jgi:hypothetical protein
MSTVQYIPRGYWTGKGNVEAVAKRIESLKDKNGHVTRERVIEDARNPTSPLHRHFTWDDTKAADKWRLYQARKLINCYDVRILNGDKKPIIIHPANVHVSSPGHPSRYMSMPLAMSQEDSRIQVLEDNQKLLNTIKHRLASMKGLDPEILHHLERANQLLDKEKEKEKGKGKGTGKK